MQNIVLEGAKELDLRSGEVTSNFLKLDFSKKT
jgi:hypothetical protein